MEQVIQKLELLFNQQTETSIEGLIAPLTTENPTGHDLRDEPIFQRIAEARLQDDSSTPRGVWELELKQADWEAVANDTLLALNTESKDLQLCVWLLEAQLMRCGFSGLAPCLYLIHQLCEQYWSNLYPVDSDGEMEHRLNIFAWVNQKLSVTLKQIPITQREDVEFQYSWSDWELALRHSQAQAAHPEMEIPDQEHDVDTIAASVNQSPIEFYEQLYTDIDLSLIIIDELVAFLDEKLREDSPSFSIFTGALEEIAGIALQQIDYRGQLPKSVIENEEQRLLEPPKHANVAESLPQKSLLNSRSDAYKALVNIADYLTVDDPHSPVPHLLYKAVDWGNMNTGELYHDLFVRQQGQLNIFDMLGIENGAGEPLSD